MASHFDFLLAFVTLFSLLFASETGAAQSPAPFKPNAFFLSVLKVKNTSLPVVNIYKRTPLKSIPLLVDLNGKFLSVSCEQDYSSSTYSAPNCHSTQCSQVGTHFCHKCSSQAKPGCHNNTCAVVTTNPLTHKNIVSEIGQDTLAIQTIQGSNIGPLAHIGRFLFACTPSSFLQGPLPKNVQGIVGFGHNPASLPMQLASRFGFPPKFAFCLSSKNNKNGVIFLGNTSYRIKSRDLSQGLQYTPLTVGSQGEYHVPVKSISINNKPVQFNTPLLSRTTSFGGTMISTTNPYTVLEHSIFNNFTQFFANEFTSIGATQVSAVPPFGVCFNKLPPSVPAPIIRFVMQNRDAVWNIYGSNSIVKARPRIWCLAFVDGGFKPRAPIVLGAYQLEDNIFEFDLASPGWVLGRLYCLTTTPVTNLTSALRHKLEIYMNVLLTVPWIYVPLFVSRCLGFNMCCSFVLLFVLFLYHNCICISSFLHFHIYAHEAFPFCRLILLNIFCVMILNQMHEMVCNLLVIYIST